jgi:protein associated with RNAse G/E
MPDFDKIEAPVKLNSAAVMREGFLLKKKEEEELKVLKDYEVNLRDEKEFERWRREMEQKDEVERLEHIQKMKIEMELAREEAI